ncbi:DUF4184 family protein [Kribbella sp. NBC_01245]|uniref:DUF4184 family protein n=1 Tax=Kribbella sp. NBC_01245 TaxID=2903578 RepID=UPI002E2C3AAD|nr:DUF4184 family protein [Kribbella sp. NBC_01245]
MPFTLAHPAAVLPLLRRPFVPAALVAGAMAPDVPYFLAAVGISTTSRQDWYGPLLVNATQTHSPWGLLVDLPFAIGLVALYSMLRAPLTALLPAGLGLPAPDPRPKAQYALWLLLSALIGIATHLVWDYLTEAEFLPSRLLQYGSTAFGLAAIGWYLWRHRDRLRTQAGTTARLRPAMRWTAVALLVAAPVLGAAVLVPSDYNAYRTVTEVDYEHPITVDHGNSSTETTYPTTTVQAPWGTVAEGVLTGAAKRAGASFVIALLLYATAWHLFPTAARHQLLR